MECTRMHLQMDLRMDEMLIAISPEPISRGIKRDTILEQQVWQKKNGSSDFPFLFNI